MEIITKDVINLKALITSANIDHTNLVLCMQYKSLTFFCLVSKESCVFVRVTKKVTFLNESRALLYAHALARFSFASKFCDSETVGAFMWQLRNK